MNLRQLELFLAVVEHGSFAVAARETFTTQSTVSQHIALLEEELGVRLLDRTRSGAQLTEPGKIVHKHARRVLGEVRSTLEAVQRYRGIEEATLRVAASTIPGGYLVSDVLALLCQRMPSLSVTLLQGDSRQVIDQIASQEAEVGVVGHRFEERGFTYAPVGGDEICLVVPAAHPWATRPSISVAELASTPLVAREPGSGTAKTVRDALARAGVDAGSLRARACLASNEAVKAAVMAGLGVSFLSSFAVRREVQRGDLAIVPVDGLRIVRSFFLVRRSGRDTSRAASAFWDLMIATYPAGGDPAS